LGDIIERLVDEKYPEIDLERDYIDILLFIHKRLLKIWFKGKEPSERKMSAKLRETRLRHPKRLEILVSYFLGKYQKRKYTFIKDE
jgi:hypothetical protein